jgi:hypothetical protein
MVQRAFEQDIFIAAAPAVVRDFLAVLHNHPKIHPLIIGVRHTSTTTMPDGMQEDHYLIRDQLRQGPFTYKITYRVTIRVNAVGEIISDAYQFPRIHLRNTTSLLAEGNGTRLKERIEITSPRLLAGIVYQQALQSHMKMLENLKRVLERSL